MKTLHYLLPAALLCAGPVAAAADVVVIVSGARSSAGSIGCALFSSDKGFPMDNSGAVQQWTTLDGTTAKCRFVGVAAGRYAISIAHDLNGNKRVDTNFLGIPTEGWAVSNNVVPTLRAPRFDEAAFRVDSADVELRLELVN